MAYGCQKHRNWNIKWLFVLTQKDSCGVSGLNSREMTNDWQQWQCWPLLCLSAPDSLALNLKASSSFIYLPRPEFRPSGCGGFPLWEKMTSPTPQCLWGKCGECSSQSLVISSTAQRETLSSQELKQWRLKRTILVSPQYPRFPNTRL